MSLIEDLNLALSILREHADQDGFIEDSAPKLLEVQAPDSWSKPYTQRIQKLLRKLHYTEKLGSSYRKGYLIQLYPEIITSEKPLDLNAPEMKRHHTNMAIAWYNREQKNRGSTLVNSEWVLYRPKIGYGPPVPFKLGSRRQVTASEDLSRIAFDIKPTNNSPAFPDWMAVYLVNGRLGLKNMYFLVIRGYLREK